MWRTWRECCWRILSFPTSWTRIREWKNEKANLIRPRLGSLKSDQMTEEQRCHDPWCRCQREILSPLSAPWIQSKRRQPFIDCSSHCCHKQWSKNSNPKMGWKGYQECWQRNGIRVQPIKWQAGDSRVKERDGIIDHLTKQEEKKQDKERNMWDNENRMKNNLRQKNRASFSIHA